jgi:hypothetical protein
VELITSYSKPSNTETESDNSVVDGSVSNVSETCIDSGAISDAATNGNSENSLHFSFRIVGTKISGG